MNALKQGALADTMMRFPWLATAMQFLMPRVVEDLKRETKRHEAHTLALIEKSSLIAP